MPVEMPIRGGARWTTEPMSGGAWTCATSASTSLPPVPAYAVSPISTAAGSAGYRTGTAALATCRIAHASPLSARPVSCAASQPLPQFRR